MVNRAFLDHHIGRLSGLFLSLLLTDVGQAWDFFKSVMSSLCRIPPVIEKEKQSQIPEGLRIHLSDVN